MQLFLKDYVPSRIRESSKLQRIFFRIDDAPIQEAFLLIDKPIGWVTELEITDLIYKDLVRVPPGTKLPIVRLIK